MPGLAPRFFYWAPRALSIAFIAFLGIFALDVFDTPRGFWPMLQALLLHLLPSFVLTAALLLAWRWEWIGAAVHALAGTLYTAWVLSLARPLSPATRALWILTIAGPAFLTAALFLAAWRRRSPHA